ncbi:hypothetical protein HMPREF0201_04035 [Cedecea davisae DSM 4568]|uniref:Uncharacterized protein n=1 Tax=Cedecea davisae DSM 4568 TaxID=566551 RepID=S3J1M7_9ENTR|nr:hypothetical protein HMPREF0201_04035 [Cedecea davisae DSM 4568]
MPWQIYKCDEVIIQRSSCGKSLMFLDVIIAHMKCCVINHVIYKLN